MKFFSKKTTKKHATADEEEEDNYFSSEASSPTKSPAKPTPASSSSSKPSKRPSRPDAPAHRDPKSRSSRSFGRQPTDAGASSSRRSSKIDPNTHPLNLPPEQLKRLSKLSAMSARNSMDVDREAAPSSPATPQKQQHQHQQQESKPHEQKPHEQKPHEQKPHEQKPHEQRSHEQKPQEQKPQEQPAQTANYTVPVTNGTNGSAEEDVPPPPPHKSNPSSPIPSTEEEAESFKASGNKHFKEKDYHRAIQQYTKAIVLLPNSATYLSNRAAAYMSAGQYESALEDCKRAAVLDPHNAKILLRLARIYTSLGQPHEALSTFERINPPPSAKDMAPAKEMLGHVKAAQNALEGGTAGSMVLHALDQAERLLGIGASKPRKWQLMRGEAYLKMGTVNALGEAANVSIALLRSNNGDPEALVLRGRALYAQGDNDNAMTHFRRALNFDPEYREAVKWLRTVQRLDRMKEEGNREYKAQRWQAAVNKYSDALRIDPSNRGTNSKILQNRALCKNKLKQYDDAIADCDRALSLDPHYNKARRTKATSLGLAERWEECVREWKAIQELEPEDRNIAKEVRKAELELKKSQRKDYYKILGVDKSADDQTIKKAYRKLAIVHHPDKNPGDEAAAERFKDIGEAYETLSDPQKRARFDSGDDLMDPADMFGGGGGGGMAGGIDPEILFSMMNGGGFGGGGGGGGGGGFPGGPSFSFNDRGSRQRGAGFPPGGFQFS